ncbi:hypothetical protein MMC22_007243 [Lobaria immixta]|nr:hypothetical protein [Lobaria immixta]
MVVDEHNGPYWVRPIREHEVDTAHASYRPTEDIYGEAQCIHEPREDSTASGQVPHEHESSHKVDRSISTHQRSPSQGHYDEEMENLRASAKAVARTFQQTADEINNGIQEDVNRLKSLLGEDMSAQFEIEPGSVELQPRAIPQSDGEEYAPGITYKNPMRGPRIPVPEDAWEAYRAWRSSFDNSPFVRESVPQVSWDDFLKRTDKQPLLKKKRKCKKAKIER